MKCASIDIGTNTLRLLVAEVAPDGSLRPLYYDRAITRLGGGYTDLGGINLESAERAFLALGRFAEAVKSEGLPVEGVKAVATSVVRRAVNKDWFIQEVKARSGLEVTVIPGDVEARFSLRGVSSVIDTGGRDFLVMDIGGGSTEFVAGKAGAHGGEVDKVWSMEMGVVHLTETYLSSDPMQDLELRAMRAEVAGVIERLGSLMGAELLSRYSGKGGAMLVGTAGTITTMAALDQDLALYDRDRINNYTLTVERIRAIYERLTGLTLAERSAIPSLEKGREDLIIPGIAITLEVMERMSFDSIRVSDAGLLEGVLLG